LLSEPSKTEPGAAEPLLRVVGLKKHFPINRRQGLRTIREVVRAVDGINLTVNTGETVGLVGESGCGKSTAGRAILRLLTPTDGHVYFEGVDLAKLPEGKLRALRKDMGIVFQDPMSALDPRMMVGDIVAEPLKAHRIASGRRARLDRARQLLEQVGLRAEFAGRYPHEFSGGQRQRIGIARAIATDPQLLILDEPISALDISVRAQILNLLEELQERMGLAYLFIAHDLSVVRHLCDRVAVMYLGVIVEEGPSDLLFSSPRHPYTQALLASVPIPDPSMRRQRAVLEGDVPAPVSIPSGCRFRTRCPLAQEVCARDVPELRIIEDGQRVACHFAEVTQAAMIEEGRP
jgi:oligopeptide/dipeptide ABC transporter ATP-binding protein